MSGAAHQPVRYCGEIYPGPRPFLTAEEPVFCGRSRETNDIANLLETYPLVVLHSQSGAGKSSLISAAIMPRLSKDRCVISRVSGVLPGPETNIFAYNLLLTATGRQPETLQLSQLIQPENQPCYLIVDQFEEVFSLYPERWRERKPFFSELASILKGRPDTHLLLVIREEWLAHLDRYSEHFPDGFRIRYRLELLREEAGMDCVLGPANLSDDRRLRSWANANAAKLVQNLRRIPIQTEGGAAVEIDGEFIDPVHLQVVCRNAWKTLQDGSVIDTETLTKLTDVDTVLKDFYEAAVARVVAPIDVLGRRRVRNWFERKLITPAGTRGLVYMDERSGQTAGIANATVLALEKEYLLHRELRAGASWFELTHDRFIRPIKMSNSSFDRRIKGVGVRLGLALVALAILLAFVGGMYLSSRNEMVRYRETTEASWAQLDAILRRRADLIPNLIATVKSVVGKRDLPALDDISKARAALFQANGRTERIAANQRLDAALIQLFVFAEYYPSLKSNENFLRLQDELARTENRLAVERRRYNEALRSYNDDIDLFPNGVFARWAGFQHDDRYFLIRP